MLNVFSSLLRTAAAWTTIFQDFSSVHRAHRSISADSSLSLPQGPVPGGSPLQYCNESRSTDLYSIEHIELYPLPLYMYPIPYSLSHHPITDQAPLKATTSSKLTSTAPFSKTSPTTRHLACSLAMAIAPKRAKTRRSLCPSATRWTVSTSRISTGNRSVLLRRDSGLS